MRRQKLISKARKKEFGCPGIRGSLYCVKMTHCDSMSRKRCGYKYAPLSEYSGAHKIIRIILNLRMWVFRTRGQRGAEHIRIKLSFLCRPYRTPSRGYRFPGPPLRFARSDPGYGIPTFQVSGIA